MMPFAEKDTPEIQFDAESLFFTTAIRTSGIFPASNITSSRPNAESSDQCNDSPPNQEIIQGTSPIPPTPTSNFIVAQTRSPSGRLWCSDRKGFLDQFYPRSLVISTIRTAILQGTTTLTNFLTDQLEFESQNEEKFVSGEIVSPLLVDQLNAEWEAREWAKRWSGIHYRVGEAVLKFHLMTSLTRLYEWIFEKYVKDIQLLDKWCKDTFTSAKRKEARLIEYNRDGYSHDGGHLVKSRLDLGKQMFSTCFFANAFSFLADANVQLSILAFGYYRYIKRKRHELKLDRLSKIAQELELDEQQGEESSADATFESIETDDCGNVSEESGGMTSHDNWMNNDTGGLLLHFFHKCANIYVSRVFALGLASAGGAVGSIVYPGWGTLFGTSLGDAIVGAVLD